MFPILKIGFRNGNSNTVDYFILYNQTSKLLLDIITHVFYKFTEIVLMEQGAVQCKSTYNSNAYYTLLKHK